MRIKLKWWISALDRYYFDCSVTLGLELQWKERKLDLGSNWAEGIRRGEVSVEVEWAVAMAGGGRVGLVCAQEELGSAFYRQGRRG